MQTKSVSLENRKYLVRMECFKQLLHPFIKRADNGTLLSREVKH